VFLGLGLTLVLSAFSIFFCRSGAKEGTSSLTRFFLVALRLSIGWHFFVEGMDKLHNPSWSSEAYLREATGPLAPKFREMAGDRLLDRVSLADGQKSPPELEIEWNAYLGAVVRFYELDADQAKQATAVLDQTKEHVKAWLTTEKRPVAIVADYPPPLVEEMTMEKRLKLYRAL